MGPDLFNPPAHRGWVTLTPSITVFGAYSDNLFLTGRGTETEDFFGGVIPGFTLSMQRPEYQLLAGYNFSAEYYLDRSELNAPFKNQQAFLDAFYRVDPRLTLSISDRFILGRDSNRITASGISAGRRDGWRNTVTPRLRYQATPLTALNVWGSYSVLRFDQGGGARDSDTYRAAVGVDHQFTPRFLGDAEVEVAYFDVENEGTAATYTGRFGFFYQLTPTLRARVRGGPTLLVDDDGDERITPSLRAELLQTFRFGSLLAGYDRTVSAEAVGVRDRHLAFASLTLSTLQRGFALVLTPRYSHSDRDVVGGQRKIDAFSVNVAATYQIARNIALIASYTFFNQREDGAPGIDQNRAFLGIQYAYPINFD